MNKDTSSTITKAMSLNKEAAEINSITVWMVYLKEDFNVLADELGRNCEEGRAMVTIK